MAEEKKNWLGPYIPEGSWMREIVQQVKLAYSLMLDRRVHPVTKLIPLAALAYLFMPVDLAPDVIPLLGQVDDLAIVMLGLRFFFEFAPPDVVHEHLKHLAQSAPGSWSVVDDKPPPPPSSGSSGEVVDGTYHVEDDNAPQN